MYIKLRACRFWLCLVDFGSASLPARFINSLCVLRLMWVGVAVLSAALVIVVCLMVHILFCKSPQYERLPGERFFRSFELALCSYTPEPTYHLGPHEIVRCRWRDAINRIYLKILLDTRLITIRRGALTIFTYLLIIASF